MPRELIGELPLRDSATGNRIDACLYHGVSEDNLNDFESLWRSAFKDREERAAKIGLTGWRDEDAHWDWRSKQSVRGGLLEKPAFVLEVDGATEGLMYCDLSVDRVSRLAATAGQQCVYLDYVATAPWNRAHPDGTKRKLRRVGEFLVFAATELSISEEYEGRISLHSLREAEEFYRKCGMVELDNDSACQNLRYFEFTASAAKAFRARCYQEEHTSETSL